MMFPYITFADKTSVYFSAIEKEDGKDIVRVLFERPTTSGIVSAECKMPKFVWTVKGMTISDVIAYEKYVKRNSSLLWKFAKCNGVAPNAECFNIGKYHVYFWLREGKKLEPIHVHIAEKKYSNLDTKLWITSEGKCRKVRGRSNIPNEMLDAFMKIIENNVVEIEIEWLKRFGKITYIDKK